MKKGFRCAYCQRWISAEGLIGTAHRNHCPFCLWSKHLDLKTPGDKKSTCQAPMKPIGLTFKHEGWNKYTGEPKKGEIMLIQRCHKCGEIRINRTAADDDPGIILKVFWASQALDKKIRQELEKLDIILAGEKDSQEIETQLFGKLKVA